MHRSGPISSSSPLNDGRLLSRTSRGSHSSAIRDLLIHARRPGVISLAGGLPSPELFPTDALTSAAPSILADPSSLQYGLTEGETGLRDIIAMQHSRAEGRELSRNDVQITSGSQQALDLVARVILDPGDQVVVADPEYLGAIGAFRSAGARLLTVPVDRGGFGVDELEAHLRSGLRPKLCYVIPEFHNPTGASTTPERLRRLAELADRFGFLIVEDSPYGALRFEGSAVASLATITPNVVQCRTISKTIAPGLRVAWMVGPHWLLEAVRIAKQSADLHSPTVTQHLAASLMSAGGTCTEVPSRHAAHYRTRCDALAKALEGMIPEAEFVSPAGGMFLWLTMPWTCNMDHLLPTALEHGVAFVPGSAFAVATDLHNTMRLSFSTAAPIQLEEGVRRLRSAILEYRASSSRQ